MAGLLLGLKYEHCPQLNYEIRLVDDDNEDGECEQLEQDILVAEASEPKHQVWTGAKWFTYKLHD